MTQLSEASVHRSRPPRTAGYAPPKLTVIGHMAEVVPKSGRGRSEQQHWNPVK